MLFDQVPTPEDVLSKNLEMKLHGRILFILKNRNQPGAGELLEMMEDDFGWKVRSVFLTVIKGLRSDPHIPEYLRAYATNTLSDDEVEQALRGNAKPSQVFKSTVDDLFRKSILYRNSDMYQEAISFIARFKEYAPYNNMLVKIQNPSCGFYATEKDWFKRFGRIIKEDAQPMLILAPKHPVLLVYDLDSTEGPSLPDKLELFAKASGDWDPGVFSLTLDNVERDKILVQFKELSSTHGGFATTRLRDGNNKMRIVIHQGLDDRSKYAVLCHELAHIYLGHLGSDEDGWWPYRINLDKRSIEIEAEATAYIVATRVGLLTSSHAYISTYLKDSKVPEAVSIELISKVAGRIEEMGGRRLPARKSSKRILHGPDNR